MRLVVVEAINRRGAGLGNEVIGWAKGFLASQVLNARLIGPAWGLNPRAYWRHFRTNRLDVVRNWLLSRVPHVRFTEDDYWRSGCVDFGHAIDGWAKTRRLDQRQYLMVSVGGMYGGYRCIRRAAPFLRSRLLASRNALANVERVTRLLDPAKLSVAVHVRLGDFTGHGRDEDGARRGQFNFRLPAEWYASACRAVRAEFGRDVQFMFFSDQATAEFTALARQFDALAMPVAAMTECSDALLMAEADLRICSVSSYSLLACFLADGPYIWYEPQLQFDGNRYRIWDDPLAVARPSGRKFSSATEAPGHAHTTGESLPRPLIAQLRRRLAARDSTHNLIEYGTIAAQREAAGIVSEFEPGVNRG